MERKRYHLNVVGDFYVEDGCCLSCGVPEAEAPGLFAFGPEQCYVRKQPSTPDEMRQMLEALYVQELGCIRYGGRSLDVIETIRCRGDTLKIVDASWWRRLLARLIARDLRRNAV
jgi:hypothetical protein